MKTQQSDVVIFTQFYGKHQYIQLLRCLVDREKEKEEKQRTKRHKTGTGLAAGANARISKKCE